MRALLFLIFVFACQAVLSQNIKVVSKENDEPIPQVVVINQAGNILRQTDSIVPVDVRI
jgi:hypothetical protein